ncbi:malto-oligosyltrehalose synthase [Dyadobacter subterraneus]|uniref:4-alpha-glucanotransferase n=1 Tax=Dyadobacter subterraneus TaxID=2773304 RepID=A0ABR9WJB8_9BACT|nr:malto-oligosyltrehalose synthase [Dyadobacter subterraneus]MBE9464254.1 malto-oligosyltrehalose synthase [Dyadobacter subterraneus]
MNNPIATYRLQFQKEFNFKDFEEIIPYLQKMGVSTIYASPIFKSTPGSTHGYDGVNPNEIDPEIGSEADLKMLTTKLKETDITWLQDIVPNHMAFHSENPWLMDVLEKGKQSVYATFFDIAWNSRLFHGKLMVPFLESDLDEVLEDGKVTIEFVSGRFVLQYSDNIYPLNPDSYLTILSGAEDALNQSVQQILSQIKEITDLEDSRIFSERWNELVLQLTSLAENEQVKSFIEKSLKSINENKEKLKEIIDRQTYALCNWQKTDEQINFRRFFTVNGLICLNIQDENVFNEYHKLIKSLLEEGVFQGIRVDHIDGLYNPAGYLDQLRGLAGDDTYVVVEKILEEGENMPKSWPIEGTTGYEFLSFVNNLLTNKSSEKDFTDFYQDLAQSTVPPLNQLRQKKSHILYDSMAGELENLYQLFIELNLTEPEKISETGKDNIKNAIGEFLIHCPVYRFYGNVFPLEEKELTAVKSIFDEVKSVHPQLASATSLLEEILLEKPKNADEDYKIRALEFYQRCMQFTGPLMAKGGEDTLMYTFNRFIGHNDVGDSPENFGLPIEDFHKKMKQRRQDWPLSLNTTSTHDTKRGEDVRARLNVLTDLPGPWFEHVKEWQELNAPLREKFSAPDINDEYLIYQTLLGAFPMPGEDEDDFSERLGEYLQKALREAKTHTTYAEPNEAYEEGAKNFALELLKKDGPFWEKFELFHSKTASAGIVNSLAQVLLKFTCPGIPDVYQGCELWDFSLVDPDNRRPIDFQKRQEFLADFENYDDQERLLEKLWENRNNAQIKLWLTHQLYNLRKENPALFAEGDYVNLEVEGTYKNNVLAFARVYKQTVLITAVPLHTAIMCEEQKKELFDLHWKDTTITLPSGMNAEWESLFAEKQSEYQDSVPVSDLFKSFPAAVLKGQKVKNERAAGVLMHISSLASPFGIGDLGKEAFAFADFLNRSNQKYWQLLPLNPTEAAQGNSPYSALSSRAGNPTLISPEILKAEGLLEEINLSDYELPQDGKTDYEKAEQIKQEILEKAYAGFDAKKETFPAEDFDKFCDENSEWLNDFALYMVLRKQHEGKPWVEWEEPFKLRDPESLKKIQDTEADQIRFVKWVQYVFDKQWKSLRLYCNERDISFLGDLPFYVSYNSSDVWAHRDLFLLDEKGKITGIAGVPPDSFSNDGQLWGMPIFNWEALKEQKYQWWVDRLRKNTELFDLVRLDHFRAFADYWEVPGGEKTAVNGTWKLGPDAEFFKTIEAALGSLPFVAEDLGKSSPAVYRLRDEFKLPGMKVLHFAFDESMAGSDFIPHNYMQNFIVYTGTHDNNTTRGWFRKDIDEGTRARLEDYVGHVLNEENISEALARLAFGSVAKTAILPIQDVLNLNENSKMNSPGSGDNNWEWRLVPGQLTRQAEKKLKHWTNLYNRN